MKAVIDANYIIDKDFPIEDLTEIYMPSSVKNELKDKNTIDFFELNNYMIIIKDPTAKYIEMVKEAIKGKHFNLSDPDIDIVALSLEIVEEMDSKWIDKLNIKEDKKFMCFTKDNGIKNALLKLGIIGSGFGARRFRMRCFACFQMYDEKLDFCKKCGHNTITRVSVSGEGENEKIHLRNNYQFKPKTLKDERGNILFCQDQREYIQYQKRQKRKLKKNGI